MVRPEEASGIIKGIFRRRLNRFVIECDVAGRTVRAHLPNPGRLWELLLSGRVVLLTRNKPAPGRTTLFTAMAVERDGHLVLLHTQRTNDIAENLLETKRIRGLEDAWVVRREVSFGSSRFDFLLQRGDEEIILEIKSCTLFGDKIAMFPDAVTERGQRHLEHLAELAAGGKTCGVLWVVHTPAVRCFMPDYHTDLAFARTFLDLRDRLFYRAVEIRWRDDLTLGDECRELEIPWGFLEREVHDRGSYLMQLHFPEDRKIEIGSLGRVFIKKGYYLYAGSAKKNLSRRVERHLRKKKRFFWHIDYLRDQAASCFAIPIRTSDNIEHELAAAVAKISDWSVPHFGASDCSCESHLFGMAQNPIHTPRFIELLQYFRMDRLMLE
ncbi:MAG: DNA/RNA nuclease SfsA [Deltaproteobacteria bacterium]|nr:DNA/RNA nuclease SfsA [Deltaproteobacteria bacterium]